MLIDIATIEIRERQRTIVTETIHQLEASIESKGLLHAPVVATDEQGTFLVAGEHRLRAILSLHEKQRPFVYNGVIVTPGLCPTTNLIDLSPADLLEAELEENIIRTEIPWQDKARALSAIHAMRVAANPKQTLADTAHEIAAKAGKEQASGRQRVAVRNATILAQNLHRPSVNKARNATEALGILIKEENAKVEAELISRKHKQMEAEGKEAPTIRVIHGSLLDELPLLPDGEIDLICGDLPYGIDADKGGFRNRTVEHHNYDDSADNARKLLQAVIAESFRICKPRANMFLFGDIDLFPFFKEMCGRMGWKAFRTPIIWQKSESEGLAPWGKEGFRRTYEMIFFATKGERGLIMSPTDILRENRVSRAARRYGPEKPVGLLRQLIECSTMPGDLVLDPCCGSGSTLAAARQLNRKAIGIELDEAAYNLSVVAASRDEAEDEKVEELA